MRQGPAPSTASGPPPALPPSRRGLAERTGWLFALGIVAYFALQALLRTLVGGSPGLDEAEQLVKGQTLAVGYGPQPPLYTWLYLALAALLGEGLATLATLKFGLLAVTLLLTYRLCRQLFVQPWPAAVAALSVLFLPQVAWEAQRALTHSVLALATVALACTLFVDLVRQGRTRDYLGFGAALAACVLAKHNAIFLPLGLLLAATLLPGARLALIDRRLGMALGLAVLLLLPNLLWMAGNLDAVLARGDKIVAVAETGPLDGLAAFARAVFSFAALPAALLALAVLLPERRLPARLRGAAPEAWRPDVNPAVRRLLTLGLALAALGVLGAVLGASADSLKDRWLAPVLFPAVPVALAWLAPWLSPGRLRLAGLAAVVVAFACLIGLWGRLLIPLDWREPTRSEAPFARLAESVPQAGTLLTTDHWLGGSLRLHRPELIVATPEYRGALPEFPPAPLLLAWPAEYGPEVPDALAALLRDTTGRAVSRTEGVRLEVRYPGSDQTLAIYMLTAAE